MSPHCAASAFFSLTSTLAAPMDVLQSFGKTLPNRFRSRTYGSSGTRSSLMVTVTRSDSMTMVASAGFTFLASTSRVTCDRDWYHWCLYRGVCTGASGAVDVSGFADSGVASFGWFPARRSSHFAIQVSYLALTPSSSAPFSKHIFAGAGSPSSKNAMPFRKCALGLRSSSLTALAASPSASAALPSFRLTALRWTQPGTYLGYPSIMTSYRSSALV
mmetsp:Transcript_5121/g.13657  ORF Transcript_5121/g.13657 Transcript_5121/m.13657 type:complete len:217 (-) Transcript_5121:106-756(-)